MPTSEKDEEVFAYFARMDHWTGSEAVSLLLGDDPRLALQKRPGDSRSRLQNTREYNELAVLFDRSQDKIGFSHRYDPALVIEWATFNDIPVPAKLVEFVEKYKDPLQDWDPITGWMAPRHGHNLEADQPPSKNENALGLHPKTKASLLKLTAGLAVRGYGYNPNAMRNETVSDIERDLQALGIPLSDDTIRKWLRIACEEIDWETIDPPMRKKVTPKQS